MIVSMFISSYITHIRLVFLFCVDRLHEAIDGSGVQVETDMLMTPVDVLEAVLGCKQSWTAYRQTRLIRSNFHHSSEFVNL